MVDISAIAVFHAEGSLAISALSSMSRAVAIAREAGLSVEVLGFMDQPDPLTRRAVGAAGAWLDRLYEVDFGDVGMVRNKAAEAATGRYLSFLDGDDLWGEDWLISAWQAAEGAPGFDDVVWHPECLFIFEPNDLGLPTPPEGTAHPSATTFWFVQSDSDSAVFDPRILLFENTWSANAFTLRRIHLLHPYQCLDSEGGFGIEDWSWNAQTLASGIRHKVVKDTVHLIRMKSEGSLNQLNQARGLLPVLPGLAARADSARGDL